MHLICDVIYIIHQTPFTFHHSSKPSWNTPGRSDWNIRLFLFVIVNICAETFDFACGYMRIFFVVLNVQWIIKWTGFKVHFVHLSCSNPDTLQCCTSYGFYIKVGTAFKPDPWQKNQELLVSCLCQMNIYACKSDEICEEVILSLNEYGRWPSLRI